MSTLIFLLATAFFTAAVVCGICYGVAVRDYGQRQELGYGNKEPYCIAAVREADRFLIIGAVVYLLGIAVLARIFWPL